VAALSSRGPTLTVDPWLGGLFAGKYQVNDLVATGGMGRVYRARQRGMERWVALKVLHGRHSGDDTVVKRFYTEMRATARIEHPHTVRVYDFGHTDDGDLFLVMELLRGPTLSTVMDAEAPMAPQRVARIGGRIARALEAAHANGVVHRDLKPDNVLLTTQYGTPDWVKVLDFGLARIENDTAQDLTAVGKRVGTPLYMAPEYIEHRLVDERSDIYALGAVLYELATGQLPYRGSAREILRQQTQQAPTHPHVHQPQLPNWLTDLTMQCLSLDPEQRPASAANLARALERHAEVERVVVRHEKRASQWRVFAVAGGVAALVVVGVIALLLAIAAVWMTVG
jgi:serine/threonine protein kinase